MDIKQCVTKKEASKLLGVTVRQVSYHLASGALTVDHIEKGKAMIDVTAVFNLREQLRKQGKRGRK